MNKNTIVKGAFVAFCIIGMLVLPAAAAPSGQLATVKGSAIDQGLKDDLWANHQQYRLQRFDMNVQQAGSVIAILDRYSIDTRACQATLTTISDKRSGLESALSDRDREKLKTVNADLRTLWQQFLKDARDATRAHYKTSATGNPAATVADGLGMAPS